MSDIEVKQMDSFETIFLFFASISLGVFIFSIVVLLLKNQGKEKDAFQQRLTNIAGQKSNAIYLNEELNKPLSERLIKPFTEKFLTGIKKMSPQSNTEAVPSDARSAKMKVMLRQAGMKFTVSEYRLYRIIILAAIGVILGFFVFVLSRNLVFTALAGVLGIYIAYVVLRFRLSAKVTSRKKSMQSQLPEVLDMISVSVEAGLGFEQAMIEVVKNFDGPLIDEIAITNREMTMGRSRNDALILLGDRCDFEEMQTFTRAIIQATQMGIAVKNVLRTQAEYMRQTHKNKIEEKAMKVSVKILIPMAFFILPVIFIVLLGPAVISILDAF
jgi:tight adherence protein C